MDSKKVTKSLEYIDTLIENSERLHPNWGVAADARKGLGYLKFALHNISEIINQSYEVDHAVENLNIQSSKLSKLMYESEPKDSHLL